MTGKEKDPSKIHYQMQETKGVLNDGYDNYFSTFEETFTPPEMNATHLILKFNDPVCEIKVQTRAEHAKYVTECSIFKQLIVSN